MKKFIHITILITIAFPGIGLLVASCSEEDFCGIGRPMLWTTFYMPIEEEPDQWVKFNLDSLTVTAIRPNLESDSVLLNDVKNVDYISLPLEYTNEITRMELKFTQDIKDTITFEYTNTPYFVSVECGFEMKQSLTGIIHTSNAIDSINIRNKETSRNATDNLRFYIRLAN